MSRVDVVVIGAGMAGLGAATVLRRTGRDFLVVDERARPGGHTSSWTDSAGFTFDEGPHISFTSDERVRALLATNVQGEYEERKASVSNYWQGRWIKHPAQCNLSALPKHLIAEILCDYHEACLRGQPVITNYEEWLVAAFGRKFAETFPMEYGLKYHTTSASNMSTDWLGPRLYRPTAAEVFRGALLDETDDVHYISSFRYPKRGGFEAFIAPFWDGIKLRLSARIEHIDPTEKVLTFADGTALAYSHLVSSMPLPELLRCLAHVPDDVREAASRLACTECVVVNIGVQREDLSPHHWLYFYDRDVVFTRVCFPHLFSPGNAPPGCGSIQVELYFSSKYRARDREPADFVGAVKRDLIRCGLLREDDKILSEGTMLLPYANVIFDLERKANLEVVHAYLQDLGILCCGRYGEWDYLWTDQSFVSGERAAQRV